MKKILTIFIMMFMIQSCIVVQPRTQPVNRVVIQQSVRHNQPHHIHHRHNRNNNNHFHVVPRHP